MIIQLIELCFFVCILYIFNGIAEAAKRGSSGYFNVKDYGARADGRTDDSKAFMAAWKAACSSTGAARLLIPKATYLLGPVQFHGPCKNVPSITMNVQGYIKAADLNKFRPSEEWVQFGWIDRLTLSGGGTFDGQGAKAWPYNKCPTSRTCRLLPTSLKFVQMRNTLVKGITSLNSKHFHYGLVDCTNFRATGFKIIAPDESPNTDGIHIERSTGITIDSAKIGTGDDCISVGHGSKDLFIRGVTCGPGHGISVGSLGRYHREIDVSGLVVADCTFVGTENGVRIKTWSNPPGSSSANNMTFRNIVMNNVRNPIIIDQTYCPYRKCASASSTPVKLRDISFQNIRGTSATRTAVTLHCSKNSPCKNVKLQNIHLDYNGMQSNAAGSSRKAVSSCRNIKAAYRGTQIPPPCR
ncbi:exopolygalacturonase-like [Magnolia sinica]|uniref:exopolygalacturonase-like n=1 Tax=Magnolia sinica TaxID=86752 RepID=UPI002659A516|nr:exopolygalacturonase-like [Magnolia sinica]